MRLRFYSVNFVMIFRVLCLLSYRERDITPLCSIVACDYSYYSYVSYIYIIRSNNCNSSGKRWYFVGI